MATALQFPVSDAPDIRATIERAVLSLAGHCDGAQERDGVGYNGYDAGWGRRTSQAIQAGEAIDLANALKVVSKYRRQLKAYGIELPDADTVAGEVERQRASAPKPSIFAVPKDPTANAVKIRLTDSGAVAIAFPYDAKKVDLVKAIDGRRFDGATKTWTVPMSSAFAAIAAFPDAIVDDNLRDMLDAQQEADAAAETVRVARVRGDVARYDAMLPALERTPYAHQDDGIRWLIENRFGILADDMGLGKTFQALVAARALAHRIFVVCPAGLRENWRREAQTVDARVEVFSWAKVPEPIDIDFTLIVDEAHYAQNMKSARTKALLALAAKAQAVFLLTGTPLKNGRPSNLFPLLVAARHPLGKNRSKYEKRYCDAHATRWTQWDTTGAAFLEELHEKISDSLLRRMKEDCLDLPEKTRVLRGVELSAAAQDRYDTTFAQYQAEYEARKASGEIAEADAIVMMNHLRHAASLAKIEAAIEIGEEVVEQGGQIVFFTAFVDSAKELAATFEAKVPVGMITGEQDTFERQDAIDAFQRGDLPVMVCTLGAGSVGITLTAAQTVVLVDRPWTPGDAMQAEDRLYRIGQRSAVTAIWLQATPMCEAMDERLQQKQRQIETVLTGEAKDIDFKVMSIAELAAKVFA